MPVRCRLIDMTSATQINSDIQFILEHILLAPSGDNTQPWRCIVDGTTIEFWYESQTAFVPKMFWESIQGRSFSYLTFGILIEHAAIAASTRGYRVIPTYFPDATQELYIAKIEIIKDDSVVPDPLISAISERSTNRNPYEVKPLQQKDRDVLMTVSSPVPGPQLKLVESKNDMEQSMSFNSYYEELLFSNKHIHQRFFSLINWSKKADEIRRMGFYITSLSSSLFSIFGLVILQCWWITKLGSVFGLHKFIAHDQQAAHLKASAFGVIYSVGNSDAAWIDAGRYVERVWLTANINGLSLQPMCGSLVIKSLVGTPQELSLLTPERKNELLKDYQTLRQSLSIPDSDIRFMFRIGYTSEKAPKTHRRHFEEIVTVRNV